MLEEVDVSDDERLCFLNSENRFFRFGDPPSDEGGGDEDVDSLIFISFIESVIVVVVVSVLVRIRTIRPIVAVSPLHRERCATIKKGE